MNTTIALAFAVIAMFQVPAEEPAGRNLKVLPPDISEAELSEVMLENLSGLGLRRLAGEGCLYCHVGDLETPRGEWDYASDAKPMKDKARLMMRMTRTINESYLDTLENRIAPEFEVTCTTCHAGRTDPRPLADVLWATYQDDGLEATVTKYRTLRQRYLGTTAYDFRPHLLPALARHMTDNGFIEDAIALAELNMEVNPDSASARQALIALQLEHIIDTEGVKKALTTLDEMAPSLPPEVLEPRLLDSLAWRLNRSDRAEAGHAIIEANYERFPDQYTAIESMAFIYADTDRKEQAFALLEGWLEQYPDHARARRLLINLRKPK